ncbi:MAG: amidohydrolase family protein [Candidatus Dormibacteria bacterium]
MRDLLLREVRLVDPFQGLDLPSCDLLLSGGTVVKVAPQIRAERGVVVMRKEGSVVVPAFLDLHCHLREPGQPWKERVANATAAAAAGGFGAICAMANLDTAVDAVPRLRQVLAKNRSLGRIPIMQFGACTAGLHGQDPVELDALLRAGAVGLSDDGRNAMSGELLATMLARLDPHGVPLGVHPEDERVLAMANEWAGGDPTAWMTRPPQAEENAVEDALEAARRTGSGSLHLQHLTTARSAELVRRAKAEGIPVTAEVTPHHLALDSFPDDPEPRDPRRTCNPPLRTPADRQALWEALLDGTIDAIASDHAPHEAATDPGQPVSAGFSGVQTALSVVLTLPEAMANLPRVVAALTTGPRAALRRSSAGVPGHGVVEGMPAHLTWIDPFARWTPDGDSWLSGGTNTPFWRQELPGQVLATFSRGRTVFLNRVLDGSLEVD